MKQETLQLLEKHGLSPKKFLGQNFLINKAALDKVIETAQLKKSDNVLEVGPGLGFLTRELSSHAKKVVAIELDKNLLYVLKQEFRKNKNVELIQGNVLDFEFDKLEKVFKGEKYKIVANIPYQITSHFIKKFLTADYHPEEMVLMVQHEVAQRITAKPGDHSLLSLSVQFYSSPEIIEKISADSFFPKPKVASAIIKLSDIQKKLPAVDEKLFFRLLKIAFSAKRKQLQNNLANGFHEKKEKFKEILEKLGFSAQIRAQELGLDDWVTVYKKLIDLKY